MALCLGGEKPAACEHIFFGHATDAMAPAQQQLLLEKLGRSAGHQEYRLISAIHLQLARGTEGIDECRPLISEKQCHRLPPVVLHGRVTMLSIDSRRMEAA